jgi:hypothetical protein
MLTSAATSAKTSPRRIVSGGNHMADAWQTLLHSVLPHLTTRRVGRLTDKSHRVVQKWYSGDMTIPDTVMHGVQDQAHLLEKTAFAADLKMIVDKAQKAGIHPEIIGSHLAAEYLRVTDHEIE